MTRNQWSAIVAGVILAGIVGVSSHAYAPGAQPIQGADGGTPVAITTPDGGPLPISAAALPLAPNAATQTTSAAILAALANLFPSGGSIGNTAFGISGSLPAFASTPTFNIGSGSISNSAFGISGTLPAFASTPTFNLGSGSISNTSFGVSGTLPAFGATPTFILGSGSALAGKFSIDQTTPGTTNAVVATGASGVALATDAHLTALGTGALATDAHLTALGTSALATDAHLTTFTSANHADLGTVNTSVSSILTQGCAGASLANTHFTPISLTASGLILTGTTAQNIYICAIDLIGLSAESVALVSGTGTNCVTTCAGLAGGTTSATGWPFASNGGLAKGDGRGALWKSAAPGDNIYLLLSASFQLSGSVVWISQ